jgi:hypothetical protein
VLIKIAFWRFIFCGSAASKKQAQRCKFLNPKATNIYHTFFEYINPTTPLFMAGGQPIGRQVVPCVLHQSACSFFASFFEK